MLLAAPQMSSLMQAPADAFDGTMTYVRICSAGAVFIVAHNVLGSIFRGIGDSRTPLMTVIFACVFNIAGDLFFVAVLGMAAEGAAIATVLAQALSVILCFFIIRKRGFAFPFSRKQVRIHGKNLGRMLKISFPIALQGGLVNISFLAIGAIVNSLGILMFSVTFFRGELLAGIFTADRQVVLASADYLKAYAIDTLIVSFLFCYIGYFNGCGKMTLVMVQGIIGAFGVRIPVSWFMSRLQPVSLFHIGLATPCSTVVQIILCTAYFLWLLRQEKKTQFD